MSSQDLLLTKADINALKRADTIIVRLDATGGYCELVRRKPEDDPLAYEQRHRLACEVAETYRYNAGDKRHDWRYFSATTLYKGEVYHAQALLALLREGDRVRFEFYPDAHRNGYVAQTNLHADMLRLIVWRKDKRFAEFEFDHSTCENNSARMCYGAGDIVEHKDVA